MSGQLEAPTYVVGAAMIPMGRHRDCSYAGLAVGPVLDALRCAGIDRREVQAAWFGHSFGGMLTGQRILKEIGIGGIPVVNVDNACSGGATALHQAARAVAAGEHEVALVVGVEKLTQFGGGTLPLVAEDPEVQQGMVMPALYAMRARRYLHDRGSLADLAAVSVKARRHGARNPLAQLRSEVTAEQVLGSRRIADPLTLFMCCPTGDGAAAVVLVSEAVRRRLDGPAVELLASVLHSGTLELGARDMLRPEITVDSAREAYEAAGLGPEELDVVELHDAFSIAELVYYEALGLCPAGEAASLLHRGETTFGGRVVVNPSGGLLAKGHPVGASGAAQVAEVFWQLTGRAGDRQVEGARTALTHVTGGGIAGLDHGACTVHVFRSA
ncbi:thiolase family protein [Nocardioides mangrovi]|uniref:propanoyl-CoA C-acyltransferase n=1 Tax=Nocardioides mangrovi TaxID=2874580 RepID=A0ABS7UFB9_9ACTN|nr:thiolase family protein [Nocardioides mangrovi]MBZ5739545.1 thiolase family protein [Nocardioides mangrovi]